jgi:uncharacterized protein with HEPN domain
LRSQSPAASRRSRLRHIADAIAHIRADTADGKKAFFKSRVHQQAVILNLMIIGEAIKHIDAGSLATRPEIPWADIAGLRDIVAHKYFHLDLETIWDVVEKDLAPLAKAVAALQRLTG